ncbi:MAG: protein O-mannosyl-transferase family [Hoylesella enoeca]|uniref:protein O-mannosyl-transferase family n=1 Tax=Hoylesella enoeca TaxID=76123 RepID=UPI003FA0EF3B
MKQYRLVDNVLGWVAFLIAAFAYCSTIEPTASFWDCPEFITTGYKLEIGHPPGAPFFMLTANLFSQFASDASQVARMVNTMSALLSATTILFLFWSITHLTRKLILKNWDALTMGKLIAIEASGMVGALIYAFSDTFWFSAVEGEVYAYSSAFTAIVFWLILKWEDHADEPHSDRWLVLITYMTGLSIGVHLLNLLCIPAIVLVFVYRKFPEIELKGSLIALLVSFVLVAAVLYGVVPGIITVGGWFELLFVNYLGCPFNTGEIVYIILLAAIVIWAIYETYTSRSERRENIAFVASVAMLGIPFYGYGWSSVVIGVIVLTLLWLVLNYKRVVDKKRVAVVSSRIKNTALLCMLMLMIGYSSYALIVIRSSANPPMDQNSPEDIFTLGNYLSRDQYGDRPLMYGQAYTSQVQLDVEGNICKPRRAEGAPIYQRKEKASKNESDRYIVVGHKDKYVYAQNMLFPRMYDAAHRQAYEDWMGGVEGTEVPYDRCGEQITVKVPSQKDNLMFFLSYQCNFMYWRYFLWNFAGRQNDIQGNGELEHGNWITGIPFIDNLRLGDQSKLPDELKNNKGHNVFYCLPLLLGIIGLFWQAFRGRRGIRQFWVVFFLFFMTGLAIVIYLNQTPQQPRERDYAYAASFYAFAIWCGIGVAAILDMIKKRFKVEGTVVSAVVALLCLLVPIQMVSQTWDDHDRSGRYTCRDFGQNYLMTLQDKGNPIIFTNGDNDTFPLWYNQDVEGKRTDARVCNLSYLQTDWYIDQMRRPAYDSPSVPITWPRLEYVGGVNDYVEIQPQAKQQLLDFYKQNPAQAKAQFGDNPFELKNILKYWVRSKDASMHFIPTDTVYVTIDKAAVKRSGMMMASDSIPDRMVISLAGKSALGKGDLMMLEMISQCNWTRPIYVALTVGEENYMNLGDNFIQEGLANRISPFTTNKPGAKNFDTEKTYRNVMTRYRYGGLEQKGLYIDETVMRMCYTHRRLMGQLALQLIAEHQDAKALRVLQKAERVLPTYNIPMTYMSGGSDIARAYAFLGQKAKATEVLNALWNNSKQYVQWYLSLSGGSFIGSMNDCLTQFYIMHQLCGIAQMVDKKMGDRMTKEVEMLYKQYLDKGGISPERK